MFKPILAPNESPNLDQIKYPLLVSNKLDGIRIIFYKGKIYTRSLKELPNKQLRERFEPIRKYTEQNNCILDGEIFSPFLTFQQIISFCMTEDFEDKKAIKKFGELKEIPEDLNFYCFDCVSNDNFDETYLNRSYKVIESIDKLGLICMPVMQEVCKNAEDVNKLFQIALELGYEGLILRDPNGKYKCGRGTLKEGIIYKLKPFVTIEAKVIGIVQATEVNEDAEKKINELNRSVTSKKVGDRHLINKASAVWVKYKDQDLKVSLACTDEEKLDIWNNQEKYIGKYIEYKYLEIGMKDGGLPRHPTSLRWRKDKDDK